MSYDTLVELLRVYAEASCELKREIDNLASGPADATRDLVRAIERARAHRDVAFRALRLAYEAFQAQDKGATA